MSIRHPARFVLIGSGNPEEGELRPQLLDRFGLSVEVTTPTEINDRIEVIRRRDDYERDPDGFAEQWKRKESKIRSAIKRAKTQLDAVEVPNSALTRAAELCLALGTDGLRGELTLIRAARALAALHRRTKVGDDELRAVAPLALRHRLRRDPLDEAGSGSRVSRAIDEVFAA